MTSADTEQLYRLLPAVYRLRDAERGGSLKALLGALAEQAGVVEADIARLYESWFIETCDEWLVPYIGELLGVRGLLPPERAREAGLSQRALVANTLRYRRRKGTLPLLEQLAHDVVGWEAHAVELFNSVAVTPHLDHLRPDLGVAASLRALRDQALFGSAFDPLAYTPDVRIMSGTRRAPALDAERPMSRPSRRLAGVGQVRPNLPNIALFIWRLQPYRVERATASAHGEGRFSFSPLGVAMPLFNSPASRNFTGVAQEHELPVALRSAALAEELEERRQAKAAGREPAARFFGPRPAFEIYTPGADTPIAPEQFLICNLKEPGGEGWVDPPQERGCRIAVDPQSGRLCFPGGVPESDVRVSYSYAFSDDVGGGPYDRRRPAEGGLDTLSNPSTLGALIKIDSTDGDTLISAITAAPAVVQIDSDATFQLHDPLGLGAPHWLMIDLKDIRQLVIQAANYRRPVLLGDLTIKGDGPGATLTLNGLLIRGAIIINGRLGQLRLTDCTVIPTIRRRPGSAARLYEPPAITISSGASLAQLNIERSIIKTLHGFGELDQLTISDSVVHETPNEVGAISVAGQPERRCTATLTRSTIFGKVDLPELSLAEDMLFTAPLTVERTDTCLLRNCYLPPGSTALPREPKGASAEAGGPPAFTARSYGEPGYAQLSLTCPAEIRTGGTQGAEIGVFHSLHQPQREGALLAQIEEYLRFGLEAGLIYVT